MEVDVGEAEQTMENMSMKLNETKLTDRLSFAASSSSSATLSRSATSSSRLSTSVSLDSLLSEDADFLSPRLSFQNQTKLPLFHSERPLSDVEMIKERFSRLLLGEDMSGSGQGVSSALAISNAITNLYASIFGQLWRLEPLPVEKKEMWRREMDLLLSVTDHIIEMVPSYKTFSNGTKHEVMACEQRSDLSINLPALRKLDSMLLELLDEFKDTEFSYVDQGNVDTDGSTLFDKIFGRQQEKWWLPVPRMPEGGISLDSKTMLQRKRGCAVQILRATMLINKDTLSVMDIPDSYLETLPKTGKVCLGEQLYKLIASDRFSVENVLGYLDLSTDHTVLERINRLESAIYLWHTRCQSRHIPASNHSTVRLSAAEAERRELFSARAEEMMFTLKHQFPHLPHSALEAAKIQCNKDVGKSILESYSRVLETLAYNIVSRIDDVLSIAAGPDKFPLPSMSPSYQTVSEFYSGPLSRNSSKSDVSCFLNKQPRHSSLTKQVLSSYLCVDPRSKHRSMPSNDSDLDVSNPQLDNVALPSHPSSTGIHKRQNSSER